MRLSPSDHLRHQKALLEVSRAAEVRYRARSQAGVDYYEGRQLSREVIEENERRDMPSVVINRFKPTVRLIVGLLLLNPQDVLARPVGANDDGLARAVTACLKVVSNASGLGTAIYKAAFQAANAGISWLHVGLRVANDDPRAEAVQVVVPDWRQVHADPYRRAEDLADCRWVTWAKKISLSEALTYWPSKAADLCHAVRQGGKDVGLLWATGDRPDEAAQDGAGSPYIDPNPGRVDLQERQGFTLTGRDADGATVDVYQTDERLFRTGWVMRFASGVVEVDVDPTDPATVERMLEDGFVSLTRDRVPYVVRTMWHDHGILSREEYTETNGNLPWVELVVEKDSNGDPVPLLDHLRHAQDEVNKRRQRALVKELQPTMVLDPTRFTNVPSVAGFPKETADTIEAKAGTPGAILVIPQGALAPLQDGESSAASWNAYKDAANEIQAGSGANDAMMGIDSSGAQSGRAKELLIQTGQQQQKPFERSITEARLRASRLFWLLIQAEHKHPWLIRITDDPTQEQVLGLNQPQRDPETGELRVVNDLQAARVEFELDVQPWSLTDRKASADFIGAMANNETNDLAFKRRLQLAAVKASDFPNRAELIKDLTAMLAAPDPQEAQHGP